LYSLPPPFAGILFQDPSRKAKIRGKFTPPPQKRSFIIFIGFVYNYNLNYSF